MSDNTTIRTTPEQRAFSFLFEPDYFGKYCCLIRTDAIDISPGLRSGVRTKILNGDASRQWVKIRASRPLEITLDGVSDEQWLRHWQMWESLRRPIPLGDVSFGLSRWTIPPGSNHPESGASLLFINSTTVHDLIEERVSA